MKEMSLKELQQFALEILKDVHRFCEENQIKYSLAYGTLIGAIRHQGFIPWDNDIDICMPRPDYERFLKTYKSEKYELAFTGKDCKYDCLIAYARVFDKQKTFVKNAHWISERTGVWIDIFPLDGVPDDQREFTELYNDLHQQWEQIIGKKIQFKRISDQPGMKNKFKLFLRKIKHLNGKGGHKLQERYNRRIKQIPYETANFWSQIAVMDNGPVEHVSKASFEETILMKFEDSEFQVMKGYDEDLRLVYGDYMTPPPESDREPHQSFIKFFWK